MAISTFDMFTLGIGPSSSHTVGPMRAAKRFVEGLAERDLLARTARVKSELFGSLGATGLGHGSDRAVLLGLEGEDPETVEVDSIPARVEAIRTEGRLNLGGRHPVVFTPRADLVFHKRRSLPEHPNGMRFTAMDQAGEVLRERVFYSVGGGFVVDDALADEDRIVEDTTALPHPFGSGAELLKHCNESGLRISSLVLENEQAWRSRDEVFAGLDRIAGAMRACIARGMEREGILPGGLKVKRRAAALHRKLVSDASAQRDPLHAMDWVNLFAMAVNEENAAGGRVVTAPTNGAAGIIPAVLRYYERFCANPDQDGARRYLLTAAAIGIIFKARASISGAEVGCQGEVGVACSMAAAGLCEVMGGTPEQATCAAEIGMEHNLGLTCDPVGGLVQVPCIERNAMGAVKAINAARLALRGDGIQKVSLDQVIETMRQTGRDMKTKYKETARGGLAVNIIEC
ncbi:MAG: L-serine ammonia-lyase [Sandaracinus sp.]|nr:L-serine ammonia-lyase [Sandaracinus sp.]|tara:strand:+ start:838 stop:2214 length:1377 start_codon:yes stop_codon:yes gene_type:complete